MFDSLIAACAATGYPFKVEITEVRPEITPKDLAEVCSGHFRSTTCAVTLENGFSMTVPFNVNTAKGELMKLISAVRTYVPHN